MILIYYRNSISIITFLLPWQYKMILFFSILIALILLSNDIIALLRTDTRLPSGRKLFFKIIVLIITTLLAYRIPANDGTHTGKRIVMTNLIAIVGVIEIVPMIVQQKYKTIWLQSWYKTVGVVIVIGLLCLVTLRWLTTRLPSYTDETQLGAGLIISTLIIIYSILSYSLIWLVINLRIYGRRYLITHHEEKPTS